MLWTQTNIEKGGTVNMETVDTPEVLKPAEVSIKTLDGTVIRGKVNLAYENRVSDLFYKNGRPVHCCIRCNVCGIAQEKGACP
jgi:hypothetical protein